MKKTMKAKAKYFAIMSMVLLFLAVEAKATSYGLVRARFENVQPYSATKVYVGDSFSYSSWRGAGVYNYKMDTDHSDTDWREVAPQNSGIVDISGFCIELGQYVNGWATYEVISPELTPRPGSMVPGTPPAGMGVTKAGQLSEFWGRFGPAYNDWGSWTGSSSAGYAEAFQLGIWEIIYEDAGVFDVTSGNFRANTSKIDWWEGGVPQVNSWLGALDGMGDMAELRALTHNSYQDLLVVIPPSLPDEPPPVVPEPLTVLGLCLGLGAMRGYVRKRGFLTARRGNSQAG